MNISNYISNRPINMNDKPTGFKMNSNPCLDLIDNNPIQLEGKIDNLYIDCHVEIITCLSDTLSRPA